jgi:type IV pilus assembly protein PilW
MTDVCLAEGIEHFHVQIGLDTDATRDGVANQFVSDPTEAEVTGKAVAARIFILARADREDPTFTNNKTYTMGDRTVTVNDKYFRRMYTTTVILRNPRNVSVFNNP